MEGDSALAVQHASGHGCAKSEGDGESDGAHESTGQCGTEEEFTKKTKQILVNIANKYGGQGGFTADQLVSAYLQM